MNNHAITVQTSWNHLDNMIMLLQTSDALSYTYDNIGTFESMGLKANYASTWGKLNWDIGGRWNAVKTNDLKIYNTEIAIEAYQAAQHLPVDGFAGLSLLKRLQST